MRIRTAIPLLLAEGVTVGTAASVQATGISTGTRKVEIRRVPAAVAVTDITTDITIGAGTAE